MRRTVVALTSGVLLLTAATPAQAAGPAASLGATLGAILATSGSTGMSVRVDVAGRGEVFAHTAPTAVAPASTEKVITAFAALRVLGPTYRFATSLGSVVAPDRNGTIHGRLVLSAGGCGRQRSGQPHKE